MAFTRAQFLAASRRRKTGFQGTTLKRKISNGCSQSDDGGAAAGDPFCLWRLDSGRVVTRFSIFYFPCRAPGGPQKFLAVARATARIGIEYRVAIDGQPLKFVIPTAAVSSMRTAVNRQHQRIGSLGAARQHDPAFYLRAILTREMDALGARHVDLAHPRIVQRAQALFAAAIRARRIGFGRVCGFRRGIRHTVERQQERETAQVPSARRYSRREVEPDSLKPRFRVQWQPNN